MTSTPDPITYGPTGYRCGCGQPAHSNLTPCAPDLDLARVGETVKVATAEAVGVELPHGIAALVDDAPALVAEVRRLRAELAAAQKQAIPWAADRLGRLIAIHREAALKVDDPADRASIAKFADGADWASGLLRQWAGEQHASDGEASR